MCTHRDVVAGKMLDDLDLPFAAFELDHHRAAVLHQPHRIVERLLVVRIAHERHVGDEEGAP